MNKWYELTSVGGDLIAVSSRVRLARNVAGLPFPGRMTAAQETELCRRVREAVSSWHAENFTEYNETTPAGTLAALTESHLISPAFAESGRIRAAFISADESVSLMACEEDHLRLQLLGPGLCLDSLYARADRLDDDLCGRLHFSFDEQLGFLTRCPTNLGCGLRASVMLHLPALSESGGIRRIAERAAKVGITLRGFFGEGSSPAGSFYQISNQSSLGLSEAEILQRVTEVVEIIIREEQRLREEYRKADPVGVADRVWRACGLLSCARRISTAEAMSLLSDLRLGLSLGILTDAPVRPLFAILGDIMPAVLDPESKMTAPERDAARAELLRKAVSRREE